MRSPIVERSLSAFLERTVGLIPVKPDSELTVGVEHEMFLNVGERPCSHDESQNLFKALTRTGWQVTSIEDFGFGPDIASLTPAYDSHTYLKYEQHPYLIELAFDFRSNLFDLETLIIQVLTDLNVAARSIGLSISASPFCCVSPDHPATRSEAALQKSLRAYRRELLEKQGRPVDPTLDNFSAVIAATQVQVGGLEWWTDHRLINALYSYEVPLLGASYLCCALNEPAENAAARRWSGYAETLRGLPLVGFPNLDQWTNSSWIDALIRTPTINRIAIERPEDFFVSVRDLQIIRPRVFGTLEFRGDPAQASVEGILAMAAIRLGCRIGARHGYYLPGSFQAHRTNWWHHVSGESIVLPYADAAGLVERAISWLQARAKGEEKFLDPIRTRAMKIDDPAIVTAFAPV